MKKSHLNPSKSLMQRLIAISSVSNHEEDIARFIKQYLDNLGYQPILLDNCIVLKIGGINSNNALIFNAHIDTVSAGDPALWQYGPNQATIIRDQCFGLGSSDEKATVAVLLLLAQHYHTTRPACDIFLTFVSREEIDGAGTNKVLEWFIQTHQQKYQHIAGILGEPTGLHEMEIAHKGNIFISITTYGDSGHASNPAKIKNHAVLAMFDVAKQMQILEKKWKRQYNDHVLGKPTIGVLTSIRAGDEHTANKFPDQCTATFDIRTTPSLHENALAEIAQTCKKCSITKLAEAPYGFTKETESIVQLVKTITGVPIVKAHWSNDLCFFTKHHIPAVVFGPGEKTVIHKPNEYCHLSKIQKCAQYYDQIIQSFAINHP